MELRENKVLNVFRQQTVIELVLLSIEAHH